MRTNATAWDPEPYTRIVDFFVPPGNDERVQLLLQWAQTRGMSPSDLEDVLLAYDSGAAVFATGWGRPRNLEDLGKVAQAIGIASEPMRRTKNTARMVGDKVLLRKSGKPYGTLGPYFGMGAHKAAKADLASIEADPSWGNGEITARLVKVRG